jgi:hypothetical protein
VLVQLALGLQSSAFFAHSLYSGDGYRYFGEGQGK